MKIVVSKRLCMGHALCAATAPELYTIDDNGYSDISELEVPPGVEARAQLGARSCPERAIEIVE